MSYDLEDLRVQLALHSGWQGCIDITTDIMPYNLGYAPEDFVKLSCEAKGSRHKHHMRYDIDFDLGNVCHRIEEMILENMILYYLPGAQPVYCTPWSGGCHVMFDSAIRTKIIKYPDSLMHPDTSYRMPEEELYIKFTQIPLLHLNELTSKSCQFTFHPGAGFSKLHSPRFGLSKLDKLLQEGW
jgi:hypothetical protein